MRIGINPRHTEGEGGAIESPPPHVLLNICQTNEAVNTKLSVPFGTSILHPMCKSNFVPIIG